MNNRLKIFTFFLFFCFLPLKLPAADRSPFGDSAAAISMDFQDANLKDVVKILSIQSSLNFIASEAVQDRRITLFLDKVPIKEAMDKIFKANNLTYELDEEAKIFIVKDWGKPEAETITRVFYLKYASVNSSSLKQEVSSQLSSAAGSGTGGQSNAAGISDAVKKLLSQFGSAIEDSRTNSLIVTDTPSRMTVIAQVISSLDVPVPQVMLEVEMLDVSKNKIDRLGIKFTDVMTSSMFGAVLTGAKISSGLPIPNSMYINRAFTKTFTTGSVDLSQTPWKIFFDFIKQASDTKILARPRILTVNNETAEIKIATQEAVGSITTTQGQGTASTTTTSAERIETGTSLRVTPQINPATSEITMIILPTVRDATTSTFNTNFKDPEERSTKSVVRVKDGETVIIGGLIRNERAETVTKVPLFSDIPLIGGLFRHKVKDKDKERELLVFITPHIIKDTNLELAQAKKTSLLTKEQITIPSPDRKLAIDASLNSFEKAR